MRQIGFRRLALGAVLVAGLLAPMLAWAQEGEAITLSTKTMRVIEVPFEIKGFRVVDEEVAKAEMIGPQKLRVLALQQGTTDLQVTGEAASRVYNVSVIESIAMVLQSMKQALDSVPEVDLSVSVDKVMLAGEISNLSHWNHIKKVVAAYGTELVVDLTSLRLPPELILQLSDGLKVAGFEVTTEDAPQKLAPNVLHLRGAGRMIYISGTVFSKPDVDKINAVVNGMRWLKAVGGEEGEAEESEETFFATLNVSVVPTMLELDVAFLAVSDEESKKVGVNLWDAGLLTIEAAGALAGDATKTWDSDRAKNYAKGETFDMGNRTSFTETWDRSRTRGRTRHKGYDNSGSYLVASELAGTLDFFIGVAPDRLIEKGHLTFRNDAADFKEFHSGGTLKVRIVSDNTADLEDIDYGLIMRVKGGLTDAENASLDVELEISSPESIPETGDWDLRRDRLATSADCPVGHTIIMAGVDKLLDGVSRSGTPLLRSVPLLKYLFDESESGKEHRRLLVLMSPQKLGAPKASRPLSEDTIKIMEEVEIPASDRERLGKRPFWYF